MLIMKKWNLHGTRMTSNIPNGWSSQEVALGHLEGQKDTRYLKVYLQKAKLTYFSLLLEGQHL